MAAGMSIHDTPPTLRRDSPSPETTPSEALGANLRLDRCLSTASTASHGSSTDGSFRDSFGSSSYSRQSSASYQSRRSDISFASSRQSTGSFAGDKSVKRRGYSRPEGTDFAASAKQRESVLSLGSIAHLQYYFARTGLLDGKGAQLARKRNPRATLDLSQLDSASYLTPNSASSDVDSSYASVGSSPDHGAHGIGDVPLVESPIEDHEEFYSDNYEEQDPNVLPPTTSTYKHREKVVPRPPTIAELKSDLTNALNSAAQVLKDANSSTEPAVMVEQITQTAEASPRSSQGWHEIQGMHILDLMTLAIRAAKVYYTSHDHPDRLDSIKSEKEIRSELLAVMEVLKHMATRNFAGGMREDEQRIMSSWIGGIRAMLKSEEDLEEAERTERAGWSWVRGDWAGREIERELAFLGSMQAEADPLPAWTPMDQAMQGPTSFLESLQNGVRLVKLHNTVVQKSHRRFGSIGTFHTDTQKPYRCADNLRYWIKAAELRWEVALKVDVMGVVYSNSPEVWMEFEQAIWKWCRKVREEITAELEKES